MLDILRHGADVEVLEPLDLRNKIRDLHAKAVQVYRTNGSAEKQVSP